MKEILEYQPPQLHRRRFNGQFVAGFGAGLIVGIVASTILAAIAIIIIRTID